MVATLHTASSDLRWTHVHAIASRGGWYPENLWQPVPYFDEKAAELRFRQKVISLLSDESCSPRSKRAARAAGVSRVGRWATVARAKHDCIRYPVQK
jgi:hypothetical protein